MRSHRAINTVTKMFLLTELHERNYPCQGHSQRAHMRIRYHFLANLHITKKRSILFLTKYDKNKIIGRVKANSKQVFQ